MPNKESLYDSERNRALKEYAGYSLEALRKTWAVYKKLYSEYPQVMLSGRISAIVKLGKELQEDRG